MNKNRWFFSFFAVLAGVCLFSAKTCPADPPAQSRQPNFVFILADDLGYGDLSCYGQEKFTTPHIDRLAEEGMKFTQFYAGSTVCAPSRCTIMTGLHTGHAFIRGNKWDPAGKGDWPLEAGTVTLAGQLKKAGYRNGCFGKWGLGMPGTEGSPMKHGFDEFYGYYGQGAAHNYYPPFLHHNEEEVKLDGKTYSHDLIEKQALNFIRQSKDGPFFCYVTTTIPHAAMQVPEDYMTPWREKFSEFENVIGKYSHNTEVRNPVAAFPAMLTRLDGTVKRIMDLLSELNLDDNTVVLFSSDNGPHHEGGHRSDFFDSNGPLRGHKRDLYEGGVRVPMIVRWPHKIKSGSLSEHRGAFWDIMPTLLELAGQPLADETVKTDGISFVPVLREEKSKQKQHEYLYWEFHEQNGKVAARWENWKAVRLNVNDHWDDETAKVELYDLEKDLGEKKDVSAEHPEIVEKFRKIFKEAHSPSELFPF